MTHDPLYYYHRHFIIKTVLFVIWGAFGVLHIFPWILHETQGPAIVSLVSKTMNGTKFLFKSVIAKLYSMWIMGRGKDKMKEEWKMEGRKREMEGGRDGRWKEEVL